MALRGRKAGFGVPVGEARLEGFVGTRLGGGETVAEFGGTRAVVSSDPEDNWCGGVNLSIPFGSVFAGDRPEVVK